MKRVNLVYIAAILLLLFALPAIRTSLSHSIEFYGIAEQPVTSYNFDFPVEIQRIFRQQGETVFPGDTLVWLKRLDQKARETNLQFEKSENDLRLSLLDQNAANAESLLENQKTQLQRDFNYQTEMLQLKINQIHSAQQLIDPSLHNSNRLQELQNERQQKETKYKQDLAEINLKLLHLKKEQSFNRADNLLKQRKVDSEIKELYNSSDDLILVAKDSGIIGQLDYGVGDKLQAFTSILKVFKQHPNQVIFYIGEQQLTLVNIGDSVMVQSLNNAAIKYGGTITAMGNRLTALPERLKKIPELRAWGREVQLRLPLNNSFLQGEKVKVRLK